MSFARTRDSLLPPLWVITVAVVVGCVWLIFQLQEIVVLLVVSYSIAYVIDPVLDYFEEKRSISRPVGVFVILAGLTVLFAVLAVTAVPTILEEYRRLASNFPEYMNTAREHLAPVITLIENYLPGEISIESGMAAIGEYLPSLSGETVQQLVGGVTSALLKGYSVTLTIVNLFLLPFIVFYLAVDFNRIHAAALEWFPMLQRAKVRQIAMEIDSYVSAYVRGQLTVGFVLFILFALGLGILGVDLWFLLAFISGFGNLVPYLGSLIGIVLTTVMALVTFGDFWHVLAVWGIFGVVQFLEGTFITPKILGDKVGLSPLVVILAILAAGSLFGLLGIFLAVPGVAIIRVLTKYFHAWLVARAQGMS